jgi:hypothetical protein
MNFLDALSHDMASVKFLGNITSKKRERSMASHTGFDSLFAEMLAKCAMNALQKRDGKTALDSIALLFQRGMINDSRVKWTFSRPAGHRCKGVYPFCEIATFSCGSYVASVPLGELTRKAGVIFLRSAERLTSLSAFGQGILDTVSHEADGLFADELPTHDKSEPNWVIEANKNNNGVFTSNDRFNWSNPGFARTLVKIGIDAQREREFNIGDQAFAMLLLCGLHCNDIRLVYQTDAAKPGCGRDVDPNFDVCKIVVPDASPGWLRIPAPKLSKAALFLFLRSASLEPRPENRVQGDRPQREPPLTDCRGQEHQRKLAQFFASNRIQLPENVLEPENTRF